MNLWNMSREISPGGYTCPELDHAIFRLVPGQSISQSASVCLVH